MLKMLSEITRMPDDESGSEAASEAASADATAVPASGGLTDSSGQDDDVDMQLAGFDSEDESELSDADSEVGQDAPEAKAAEEAVEPEAEAEPKVEPKIEAEPKPEAKAGEDKAKGEEPAKAVQPPAQQKPLSQQLTEGRKGFVDELTKMYTLSDDDLDAFDTDVEARRSVLTKLAGELHFNVLQQASAMIENMVPGMINSTTQQQQVQQQVETQFVEAFPDLGTAAMPKFWTYAKMIASQNPQTPTEQVIKTVGNFLMAEAGKLQASPVPKVPAKKKSAPAFTPATASAPPSNKSNSTPSGFEATIMGFEEFEEQT